MNAFVTGSHAYGKPRPDSNLDLVVLADDETIGKFAREFDKSVDYGGDSLTIRQGAVNLILETSPAKFAAWKFGTEKLIQRMPVTREEAVKEFKSLFSSVGEEDAEDKR